VEVIAINLKRNLAEEHEQKELSTENCAF